MLDVNNSDLIDTNIASLTFPHIGQLLSIVTLES